MVQCAVSQYQYRGLTLSTDPHPPSCYRQTELRDVPLDVPIFGFPVLLKKEVLESVTNDEGYFVMELRYHTQRSRFLTGTLQMAVAFTDEAVALAISNGCAMPLQRAKVLLQTAHAPPRQLLEFDGGDASWVPPARGGGLFGGVVPVLQYVIRYAPRVRERVAIIKTRGVERTTLLRVFGGGSVACGTCGWRLAVSHTGGQPTTSGGWQSGYDDWCLREGSGRLLAAPGGGGGVGSHIWRPLLPGLHRVSPKR